jgi:four helix bundle protein
MTSYRDLEVWRKSYALALSVYRATHGFPPREAFGLTSQVRRAAVSILANMAEGYCRHSRADYLRFLAIAQGSAGELDTLLSLGRDLSYLEASAAEELTGGLSEVGRMLTGLTRSLRTEPRPPVPAPRP